MGLTISRNLSRFDCLSLQDLNAKAAMLERLDNKYIVSAAQLRLALDEFRHLFDVLEIEGRRAFSYATRYYDSEELWTYHAHHQGRRKRSKVRVREYLDAGFSYLEVKLKDKRKITVKKRLKVPTDLMQLDARCIDFVESCHDDLYGEPFGRPLQPVIDMEYKRITLVAKEGGERMTIDTQIDFHAAKVRRHVPGNMFIIETKSARGNGIADRIMRSHHLHPTARCSKYCIGMAALKQVKRHNHFLPALRRLKLLDPAVIAPAAKAAPIAQAA